MFIRHQRYMSPLEDGGGGGAGDVVVDAPAVTPVSTPAVVAPATTEPAAPTSMLEAINQHFDRERDDKGRFTPKTGEQVVADPKAKPVAQVATAEVKPAAKPDPKDILQMPDGLAPASQQRFQQLANTVKELQAEVEPLRQQTEYIGGVFKEHGVSREQFEQATSFIGAINRGNYQEALQIIDQQRQQLALAMGKPLPGVDALSAFPDLRQRVDQLQLTEEDALEMAKLRSQQSHATSTALREREQAEQAQAQQHEVKQATMAVDQWCRQTAQGDLDWPAIEEKILPRLQQILDGVPPAKWVGVLKANYELMKSFQPQRSTAVTTTVLRPTGGGATQSAPKTAFEAMWGTPQPA